MKISSRKIIIAFFIFAFIQTLPVCSMAQNLDTLEVPKDTLNYRFHDEDNSYGNDYYIGMRPALSIQGFDSKAREGNSDHGLGLKQILIKVFDEKVDEYIELHSKLLEESHRSLIYSDSRSNIEDNSKILEARAYEALVSYILDKNGYNLDSLNSEIGGEGLKDQSTALTRLKDGITNPPGGNLYLSHSIEDDAVKWTRTLANMARMWDLYFALENAYAKFDPTIFNYSYNDILFGGDKRKNLIKNYHEFIGAANQETEESVDWGGLEAYDVDEDEVQNGNWPLKTHTAIGYALLGAKIPEFNLYIYDNIQDWMNRAVYTAGYDMSDTDNKGWKYQTSNGKRFWAEGPFYLHYALEEVIPFWHALRGTDNLQQSFQDLNYSVNDPFDSGWLNRPLNWLADIVTPNGRIPPVDDGNKDNMDNSDLLQWKSNYGSYDTLKNTRKFAWINNKIGEIGRNKSTLLVTISQPLITDVGQQISPKSEIGNTTNVEGNSAEQQIVLRNKYDKGGSTENHYLYMQGEQEDAIFGGEGHEQPDQLQLLYYIDGNSYLMDAGYDDASGTSNSTWNNYTHHNAMEFYGVVHSLDPPYLSGSQKRVVSTHNQVDSLIYSSEGNLDVLSGEVVINNENDDPEATYERKSIYVQGNDTYQPYLIDFNNAKGDAADYEQDYYFNSNDTTTVPGWFVWNSQNKKDIYFTSRSVSGTESYSIYNNTSVQEDDFKEINQLAIYSASDVSSFSTIGIIKISNQQPNKTLQRVASNSNFSAYKWDHSRDTVDVFIHRSDINKSNFEEVTFKVSNNKGNKIAHLQLEGDEQNGFARLIRGETHGVDLGEYEIDPNYQHNLEKLSGSTDWHYYHYYSDVVLYNELTYPYKSKIYISDNTQLSIEDSVTFQGAIDSTIVPTRDARTIDVFLGKGAEIIPYYSGHIVAKGVDFQSYDPDDPSQNFRQIKIAGVDKSIFKGCVIRGGNNGIIVEGSEALLKKYHIYGFDEGYTIVRNNDVGVYSYINGDVTLKSALIYDNSSHGIYTYDGNLKTTHDTKTYYDGKWKYVPTVIQRNGESGIFMSGSGYSYVQHSRTLENGYRDVFINSNSTANLGDETMLDKTSENYIYLPDEIMISSDLSIESWDENRLIKAENNWWADYNNHIYPAPGPSEGDIDVTPQIGYSSPGEDPTYDHPANPYDNTSQQDTGKTYSNKAITYEDVNVSGSNKSGARNESLNSGVQSSTQIEKVKNNLTKLVNQINENPLDIKNVHRMQRWYNLLYAFEDAKLSDFRDKFLSRLEKWENKELMEQYTIDTNYMEESYLNTPDSLLPSKQAKIWKHIMLFKEKAQLLDIRRKMDNEKIDEALSYTSNVESSMVNKKHRHSLKIFKSEAAVRKEDYQKAWNALTNASKIQPDTSITNRENYKEPDYSPIFSHWQRITDTELSYQPNSRENKNKEVIYNKPEEFKLKDNFPNPFNPTTTIRYAIPYREHVQITVYNALGRKVATLVDETKKAGHYTIRFNASDLASGLYIYKISAGKYQQSKRMMLIK